MATAIIWSSPLKWRYALLSVINVRRLPVPAVLIVVVSAVIFLFIFFGAWAVSADASSTGRGFSLGYGAIGTTSASNSAQTLNGDRTDASDSWWGNGLLKACPFH